MRLPVLKYAFSRDEAVGHGFNRILAQIGNRFRYIAGHASPAPNDQVHDARVLVKRLRALLWFVHSLLAKSVYERAKSRLRRASGLLSAQRDVEVTRQILAQLAKKSRVANGKVFKAAANDAGNSGVSSDTDRSAREASLTKAMSIVCFAVEELKRKAGPMKEVGPDSGKRVAKAREKMIEAEHAAHKTGKDSDFHAWRKAAKRLVYVIELSGGAPKSGRRKRLKRIDKLQDRLGAYHDLVVAQERLRRRTEFDPLALGLLKERKARLRRKAEKLGRKSRADE
jgi:CHAD domain-containing protein